MRPSSIWVSGYPNVRIPEYNISRMPKFKGLELLREESGPRETENENPSLVAKTARPIGKRQNPAYQQISAYVRRDLYERVRRELIGKTDDFSDLLESWMQQWLSKRH
jgi:hypothetical protein